MNKEIINLLSTTTKMTITPNEHEKSEWGRFALDAYAAGMTATGHRFLMASSTEPGIAFDLAQFDSLQTEYRQWLNCGFYPVTS